MLVRPTSRQRGTFVRSVAAASIAIAATLPQVLNAQQAQQPAPASDTSKTHTVKRGDTLWDLAKSYLGDSFLWPEVYRLNTGVIEDPHWIYPGELLKLPGDHAKVVAVAEPGSDVPAAAAPATSQPEMNAAAAAPPEPSVLIPPALAPVVVHDTATPMLKARVSAVRAGEYIASPWVDRDGGPKGPGMLIESADISGVALSERSRLQLRDPVFLAPPAGVAPMEHALYMSYRLGPLIEDFGQIVIPTGIIEVTQAGSVGEASVGHVVAMFNEVKRGQNLIPLDSGTANVIGHPSAVSNGHMGHVRWVLDEPVLPSVQSYVVLDISARDGIVTGDQIEIYKGRQRPNESHDLTLPEISIAHAQILRVTQFGATAIVLDQGQPLVEGAKARVAAKMP